MRRYGMVIRLRPERRDTYLRLHAAVWPGVEQTLREGGGPLAPIRPVGRYI